MVLRSVASHSARWGIDGVLVDLEGVAVGGPYPKAAVCTLGHLESTVSFLVSTPFFCNFANFICSHWAKLQEVVYRQEAVSVHCSCGVVAKDVAHLPADT